MGWQLVGAALTVAAVVIVGGRTVAVERQAKVCVWSDGSTETMKDDERDFR